MEAQHKASFQISLDSFSGCGSNPSLRKGKELGYVRERILRKWYQPGRNTVQSEQVTFKKLTKLHLVPKQQSTLDSGVRLDQFSLD